MSLEFYLFYVLAALTAVSAIAVVVVQNIVRAAMWLLFALVGTAGVYFMLGADFVGATQILVYVGGTLVLVVFGVMLTAQGPFINMRIGAVEWVIGAGVGLLFYSLLAVTLVEVDEHIAPLRRQATAEGELDQPKKLASSVVLGESLLGLTEATAQKELTGIPLSGTDKSRPLFGVPPGPESDLDAGRISDSLRKGFQDHREALPENVSVREIQQGRVWQLDTDNRRYIVRKDDEELNVYPMQVRRRMAYLLPFEIVSVHLLVVLIGAAYLARAKRRVTKADTMAG